MMLDWWLIIKNYYFVSKRFVRLQRIHTEATDSALSRCYLLFSNHFNKKFWNIFLMYFFSGQSSNLIHKSVLFTFLRQKHAVLSWGVNLDKTLKHRDLSLHLRETTPLQAKCYKHSVISWGYYYIYEIKIANWKMANLCRWCPALTTLPLLAWYL